MIASLVQQIFNSSQPRMVALVGTGCDSAAEAVAKIATYYNTTQANDHVYLAWSFQSMPLYCDCRYLALHHLMSWVIVWGFPTTFSFCHLRSTLPVSSIASSRSMAGGGWQSLYRMNADTEWCVYFGVGEGEVTPSTYTLPLLADGETPKKFAFRRESYGRR